MANLLLRLRLFRGRCKLCSCKIPNNDISNSIKGDILVCKKCRGEGAYDDRCPICNGGKKLSIEYRIYNFQEVQRMHENCFMFLTNDSLYQRQFGLDDLIEKRNLICPSCHYPIMRENPQCPYCKKKQEYYKQQLEKESGRE